MAIDKTTSDIPLIVIRVLYVEKKENVEKGKKGKREINK